MFCKWLGDDYDTHAMDAMLAATAVEKFDDGSDPIWLLLVSGPGAAKTETVQALDALGPSSPAPSPSDAALLSGTPQHERAKGHWQCGMFAFEHPANQPEAAGPKSGPARRETGR